MATSKHPHLIWFWCDQLRPDAVGFMGNPIVRTPNLDRLAREGVVFDKLFVQSSVCMPSRACALTSRYLRNTGMANGSPLMPPSQVTIAEHLQRLGYATGHFGKLHLTPQEYTRDTLKTDLPVTDAEPFLAAAGLPPMPADPAKRNYGFQHVAAYEDALRGTWRTWAKAHDPAAPDDPRQVFHADFPDSILRDVGVLDLPVALHPSTMVGETAAEWFSANHADHPCFLHVSFVDPHHPWDPPAEIAKHYPADAMPLPKHRDWGEIVWPERLVRDAYRSPDVTDTMTRTTIGRYYAMIETLDLAVGQVIAAVEAAGELENTVFAFVADHGELLGDCGLWRKGSYHYDCMIQVPSFICAPGRVPGGRRVDGLVQAIDLAPTLLGLAELPICPGMQGLDLAPALRDGAPIGRPWTYTELFTTSWGPYIACWSLRTATAKLNYFPEEGRGHLFDLAADPDERRDLWASPDYRELRDTMTALLLKALHSQADPLPKVLSQY